MSRSTFLEVSALKGFISQSFEYISKSSDCFGDWLGICFLDSFLIISIKESYCVWVAGIYFNSDSKSLEKAGQFAFMKLNLLLEETFKCLILARTSPNMG